MTSNRPPCPPGAHTHPSPVPQLVLFAGAQLALDDQLLALCPSEVVAERLAELINRHGLLEVPATVPPYDPAIVDEISRSMAPPDKPGSHPDNWQWG